jgi:hypothetical protein
MLPTYIFVLQKYMCLSNIQKKFRSGFDQQKNVQWGARHAP